MDAVDTVLLVHRQAEDTHLDWMLDLPAGGAGLTTFRCGLEWPDWRAAGRVGLTELPPHRPVWLQRQGVVSGGRGRATRRLRGTAEVRGRHRHGFRLRLRWNGPRPGCVAGRVARLRRDRWEFLADQPAGPGGAGGPGRMLRPGPGSARSPRRVRCPRPE